MTNSLSKKIKIAIVDDHSLLREGLKKILLSMDYIELSLEASNGKEFVDALDIIDPDLAIIDINMPVMNGEEAIRIARKKKPHLKFIVLSMNNEESYLKAMNKLNVDGYIVKESDYEDIERAIKTVMKGGKYYSQELMAHLLNKPSEMPFKLTDREAEILQLICDGFSVNEIAEKLFISPRTVEKHRTDLFAKTNTSSSVSLAVYAVKNKLVSF